MRPPRTFIFLHKKTMAEPRRSEQDHTDANEADEVDPCLEEVKHRRYAGKPMRETLKTEKYTCMFEEHPVLPSKRL